MGVDFPIPRSELPVVSFSDDELRDQKLMMHGVLQDTLLEYESYCEVHNKVLAFKSWHHCSEKEKIRVYKKRSHCDNTWLVGSEVVSSTPYQMTYHTDTDSAGSEHTPRSGPLVSINATTSAPTAGSSPMILIGEVPGTVDQALFGISATTDDEQYLVNAFMYPDAADSSVLHVMEGALPHDPYHSISYKWYATKAGKALVKCRDTTYLEYMGSTTNYRGERMGFYITQSVTIPGFTQLSNFVRAEQSIRFLFRQKGDSALELFMLGCSKPNGMLIAGLASLMSVEMLFDLTKLVDVAEAKQLTRMVHERQRVATHAAQATRTNECSLCRRRMKFYSTVSMAECHACGKIVCSKCRVSKRCYMAAKRGLGQFLKMNCCKPCLLVANAVIKPPIVSETASNASASYPVMPAFNRNDSVPSSLLDSTGSRSSTPLSMPRPRPRSAGPMFEFHSEPCNDPRVLPDNEFIPLSAITSRSSSFQPHPSDLSWDSTTSLTNSEPGGYDRNEFPTAPVQSSDLFAVESPVNAYSRQANAPWYVTASQPTTPLRSPQTLGQAEYMPITTPTQQQYMPITSTQPQYMQPMARAHMGHHAAPYRTQEANDLFSRMLALREVAESTYNTTKETSAYLKFQRQQEKFSTINEP